MIIRRLAEGIKHQDWFVVMIEIFEAPQEDQEAPQ